MILKAGRVREKKRKKENKNQMVNYFCLIFWFATQTFNRGEKKTKEYKYKMNVTYVRFEYKANRQ